MLTPFFFIGNCIFRTYFCQKNKKPILRKLSNLSPKYKKYREINTFFEKLGNSAPFFYT